MPLFALILVAALLVVGAVAESASRRPVPKNDRSFEPNRSLGEMRGDARTFDCIVCHTSWNPPMTEAFVVYPIVPLQYAVEREDVLPVQIINPWISEIRNITLNVTLLGDPILAVHAEQYAGKAPQDENHHLERKLGPRPGSQPKLGEEPPAETTISIPFASGMAAVLARAFVVPELDGTPMADLDPDTYEVRYVGTHEGFYPRSTDRPERNLATARAWNYTYLPNGGGVAEILVRHTGGSSRLTNVYVHVHIVAKAPIEGKTYHFELNVSKMPKYGSETFNIPITPFRTGTQDLIVHVRAMTWHIHGDRSYPTFDFYNRYAVLNRTEDIRTASVAIAARHIVVGDTFVANPFGPLVAREEFASDFKLVMGEVTGFASATLLLPSLLLGGAYGKNSRRLLNFLLGGAKRRVMFHNLLSLGLSLAALVHILLFMLEAQYSMRIGLLWGGLGAVSLLVLGLTGYYQVPLIQRHGFRRWQVTHLAFGILILIFVASHALLDGADFVSLKQQLPQWARTLNVPGA